jgi:hypothetical protein
MTKADIRQVLKKPPMYVGIGVALIIIAAIVTSFIVTTHTAAPTVPVVSQSDTETAYVNIVKESLAVYRARYAHYPDSYQTLLDDITASPALYGVNDEGLSALTAISGRLSIFTYTSDTVTYQFTYQAADTGKTVTIKSN